MTNIERTIDVWVGESPESVGEILQALSQSVMNTAQHCRENWQDNSMAKCWERISGAIDKAQAAYEKNKPF